MNCQHKNAFTNQCGCDRNNLPTIALGRIVATPGAIEALQEAGVHPLALLNRHATKDWGDLDEHDKRCNESALKDGSRILSAYTLSPDVKVWIITEAENDDGQRESTCVLLPEEY